MRSHQFRLGDCKFRRVERLANARRTEIWCDNRKEYFFQGCLCASQIPESIITCTHNREGETMEKWFRLADCQRSYMHNGYYYCSTTNKKCTAEMRAPGTRHILCPADIHIGETMVTCRANNPEGLIKKPAVNNNEDKADQQNLSDEKLRSILACFNPKRCVFRYGPDGMCCHDQTKCTATLWGKPVQCTMNRYGWTKEMLVINGFEAHKNMCSANQTDQGLLPDHTEKARELAQAHWSGHDLGVIRAAIDLGIAIGRGDPAEIEAAALSLGGVLATDYFVHGYKHAMEDFPTK